MVNSYFYTSQTGKFQEKIDIQNVIAGNCLWGKYKRKKPKIDNWIGHPSPWGVERGGKMVFRDLW